MPPYLIAPPESEGLGRAIAQAANWEWAAIEERRFAGGEFTLRPLVAVGNRDVCLAQFVSDSTRSPHGTADFCRLAGRAAPRRPTCGRLTGHRRDQTGAVVSRAPREAARPGGGVPVHGKASDRRAYLGGADRGSRRGPARAPDR